MIVTRELLVEASVKYPGEHWVWQYAAYISARVAVDPFRLSVILFEAKQAHTRFEAQMGADPDWAAWYAEYANKALGVRDGR